MRICSFTTSCKLSAGAMPSILSSDHSLMLVLSLKHMQILEKLLVRELSVSSRSAVLCTFVSFVSGIFQGLSFLETIHGVLGLVKGSPVASLMQWGGRSNVLYGVIAQIPEVHKGFPVAAMLLAWASSEVIRYPWYASSLASCTPQWLTWLRYTAFIPLYPIGLIGEMGVVYQALPYLSARHIGTLTLPNSFNLSFEYCWFLRALMLLYPFLWWQLYSMLLKQRRMKVKRD